MAKFSVKATEVGVAFFEYASGLGRDGLLRLLLTRMNTRTNLRKEGVALLEAYLVTLAEIRLCNWLLRNGESAVSDADAAFLLACGVSPAVFRDRRKHGKPNGDRARGAHVPTEKAGSHRAAKGHAAARHS